jgi:hypothetical protein
VLKLDKRKRVNYIITVVRSGLIRRRSPAGEGAFTAPGGQAVKELMTSCYKAIIEGQGCYVSGWTLTGTLQLADGSEIAMTPLFPQQKLSGKIWRIARLKRRKVDWLKVDWLIDGVNLSSALSRPGALPNWPKTQYYHALRMLSEMLNLRLVSGCPGLWSDIGTKELQSAVEKKALCLEKLRSVVAVAFTDSNMTRGFARSYIATTNHFKRHDERMLKAPTSLFIPILLTRFDVIANRTTNDTLRQTQDKLDKAEQAASLTLNEAVELFMRLDLPGINVRTRARIKEAVFIYNTDPEKHSLTKIAKEFRVSKQCVSKWFKQFKSATGVPVITHQKNESVRSHFEGEHRGTMGNIAKKKKLST